jgi:hypothetical protein
VAKRSKQDTEAIREVVRSRAAARCQCTHEDCAHHTGRCGVHLGSRWDVHKKNPEGAFNMLNLEAFCVRCFRNARMRERKAGKKKK